MVPSRLFFKKTYTSYLQDLVVQDSKKLERILNTLEGKCIENPIALPPPPFLSKIPAMDYTSYIEGRGIC